MLVLIHGAQARLYRCQVIGGSPRLVLPYEASLPDGDQPPARVRAPATGPGGNFVALAEELQPAGQIVIFGVGSGGEAAKFAAWLRQHDSELSGRIMAHAHLDQPPLDDAALLRAALEVYAALPAPVANERRNRHCQPTGDTG